MGGPTAVIGCRDCSATGLARLGPHKTSVSCLYIRKLDDVDLGVLRKVIARSLQHMKRVYSD